MLNYYRYFHKHDGSYEALLRLESVDVDAGTAGQYPTMSQWDSVKEQTQLQYNGWLFKAGGRGYMMQGERTSPRGIEYIQLILVQRGEMTVRQLAQRIKSVSTETIRKHLELLIKLREVQSKQVGKKVVYYSTIKYSTIKIPAPCVDPLDDGV